MRMQSWFYIPFIGHVSVFQRTYGVWFFRQLKLSKLFKEMIITFVFRQSGMNYTEFKTFG